MGDEGEHRVFVPGTPRSPVLPEHAEGQETGAAARVWSFIFFLRAVGN